MIQLLVRWIAAWLIILALAVLNGFLREAALVPLKGKAPGYLSSGLLLALWHALTLAFEFGFGILQGRSWAEMLAQYTFTDGNIWPLVFVFVLVLFAPWIGWRYHGAS